MRRLLTTFLIASQLGTATVAHSQPGDPAARRATYERGMQALRAQNWAAAALLFEELWQQERTYDVALLLGQAELNTGKYRNAAEHLEFGIRTAPVREDPNRTARSRNMLRLALKEVGSLEIRVDQPGAEVRIDRVLIGTAPLPSETFVEPGARIVEANLPGHDTARQTVQAAPGQKAVVELHLVASDSSPPAPVPALGVPPRPSAPEPSEPQPSSAERDPRPGRFPARTAVLVGGIAATAIAAGVGIAFTAKGSSAGNDAERGLQSATSQFGSAPCSTPVGEASSECQNVESALDREQSSYRVANVAFILAGVAGISTALTFALWPARNDEPPRSVRVSPFLGPKTGGASLTFGF